MQKQIIKRYVPGSIWSFLRLRSILIQHKKVSNYCNDLIRRYFNGELQSFEIKPHQALSESRIIWQYWGQGFDGQIPEVVAACLRSVDKHKGSFHVIRLDDESFTDYVTLPDIIISKKGTFPKAFFSDVLRLALVYAYGGIWLDATIFMTREIPERYFQHEWFMFQRDPNEPHKKYWENAYAYYYGWDKKFKVRLLNSIIFSKKGSEVIKDLYNLLVNAWAENDSLPDYFFFQILFNEYVTITEKNCPIESDCRPQYLQQIINDKAFIFATPEEAVSMSPFHKFSYKEINMERFKTIMSKYIEL